MNKINALFLDFDGVINTDTLIFNGKFDNKEAIDYISKFCNEYSFKIVVTSSWKRNPSYKELLYNSGLDKNVEILGSTEITSMGREYEIKSYLEKNSNIDKYLIIDDMNISNDLSDHLIQTSYTVGYNKEKYIETIDKYNSLYN